MRVLVVLLAFFVDSHCATDISYLGCHTDDSLIPLFSIGPYENSTMTPEICNDYCANLNDACPMGYCDQASDGDCLAYGDGFHCAISNCTEVPDWALCYTHENQLYYNYHAGGSFFGIQGATQCYCSSTDDNYAHIGKLADSACAICPGDATATCGNTEVNSVYDLNRCRMNNGGCDPLTICYSSAGDFHCGPCPDGYVGTGDTRCAADEFDFEIHPIQDSELSSGWNSLDSVELVNGEYVYNSVLTNLRPSYWKDELSIFLDGVIAGGSTGSLLTLPEGYRPIQDSIFLAATAPFDSSVAGSSTISVRRDGTVTVSDTIHSTISLNARFRHAEYASCTIEMKIANFQPANFNSSGLGCIDQTTVDETETQFCERQCFLDSACTSFSVFLANHTTTPGQCCLYSSHDSIFTSVADDTRFYQHSCDRKLWTPIPVFGNDVPVDAVFDRFIRYSRDNVTGLVHYMGHLRLSTPCTSTECKLLEGAFVPVFMFASSCFFVQKAEPDGTGRYLRFSPDGDIYVSGGSSSTQLDILFDGIALSEESILTDNVEVNGTLISDIAYNFNDYDDDNLVQMYGVNFQNGWNQMNSLSPARYTRTGGSLAIIVKLGSPVVRPKLFHFSGIATPSSHRFNGSAMTTLPDRHRPQFHFKKLVPCMISPKLLTCAMYVQVDGSVVILHDRPQDMDPDTSGHWVALDGVSFGGFGWRTRVQLNGESTFMEIERGARVRLGTQ